MRCNSLNTERMFGKLKRWPSACQQLHLGLKCMHSEKEEVENNEGDAQSAILRWNMS